MQLLSIETHNFKKLRHFKASFTEGLNVIVGDNAQGKSTLLQAIECALYGATVVPGKKDKIPTWGQSTWKIQLLFVAKDDRYLLTRSKTTAKLELVFDAGDPQLVANGNTPVTAAIEELLDLNAKDFNLFMQSKQGETSGVLTFGAAALNRKVEAFAGISLIDRVQSLAQEEYRTKKAEADAKAVPEEQIDSQQADCVELSDALHATEVALKAAQEALKETPDPDALEAPSADPDVLQGRLTQVNRLRGKLERADVEVRHAQQRRDEAQQRFEEAAEPADVEALEEKLDALKAEIQPAVKAVNDLQRELSRQEHLWGQLVEAEKEMDRHLPEDEIGNALSHEVEQQTARHDERRAEQHRVVELNQQIKQLQSLREDANCPTCGTRLTEHDPEKLAAEIEQLASQRDHHEHAWHELTRVCQAIDKQVKELEDGLAKRQAAEAKVDRLREELAALGIDMDTAESPVEKQLATAKEVHEGLLVKKHDLEHDLERQEAVEKQYRRLQRAAQTEADHLEEAKAQLEEFDGQLAAAEAEGVPTEEDIRAARAAWDRHFSEKNALYVKRQEAKHAVDMAEREFQQAQERLEHANTVLESLRRQRVEAVQTARDADQAARLTRFLRERRAGYLQEVWDAVLAAASKQVALASKGMIGKLVYDEGDFLFEEDGVLAPVASASGAQKAHIGVALRIGLSRALYGSDALIIFDEPTESMSEHHASGLSASLAGAASQCLLITHREQDQDLAANVVEVAA